MKMTLNPNTKNYMLRMLKLREEKKLSVREEIQLFQDLYDSGLLFSLSKEYITFAKRLKKVDLLKGHSEKSFN